MKQFEAMKKIVFLLSLATFCACSDELNESKATKIIEGCKQNIETFSVKIPDELSLDHIGDSRFSREKADIYLGIYNDKYLTFDTIETGKSWFNKYYTYHELKPIITKKGEEFVVKSDDNTLKVKVYDIELVKILEVHEVPAFNAAEVKALYVKTNKTPFYELAKYEIRDFEKKDTIQVRKMFNKTEKGWKLCDE